MRRYYTRRRGAAQETFPFAPAALYNRPWMLTDAEVTLSGRPVRYTLRRSARARWVSGWIRPETGLVVTLPISACLEQAEAFLLRHQRWVIRQLKGLARLSEKIPRPWPYGTSLL